MILPHIPQSLHPHDTWYSPAQSLFCGDLYLSGSGSVSSGRHATEHVGHMIHGCVIVSHGIQLTTLSSVFTAGP